MNVREIKGKETDFIAQKINVRSREKKIYNHEIFGKVLPKIFAFSFSSESSSTSSLRFLFIATFDVESF